MYVHVIYVFIVAQWRKGTGGRCYERLLRNVSPTAIVMMNPLSHTHKHEPHPLFLPSGDGLAGVVRGPGGGVRGGAEQHWGRLAHGRLCCRVRVHGQVGQLWRGGGKLLDE